MKILLIGLNSKYIHPSMGIFQIIANSKYDINYKEFTIKDQNINIINFIKNENFDILGFSVYIWNISKIKEILLNLDKNLNILLGGPEVSFRPNDFLNYDNVKYIIKNEGEESFNILIDSLEFKKSLDNVPNLFYKIDNKFIYTYDKIPNIANIKHDYSLIKDFDNRIIYLEASRGCCFKCSYCLASLDKSIRYFDLNHVKEDILFALYNNAKTVKFLDRSFNVNQKHMQEIIHFIRENDNNITTFQFEIVADLLDKETISLLQTIRKGLIRFEIGIQSTNDVVTQAVRRVQNFHKLQENINAIKDNIIIHTDLIAGLPYEDKESFIRTFNQTFSLFCEELQLGFLKELQGTHISDTKYLHDYEFSKQPPYEIIKNKYISKHDLDEIRLVELSLNKIYNSNNFPKTCHYLFIQKKFNPYFIFLKISKFITNIFQFSSLQFSDFTKLFYLSLKDITDESFLFILKQDFLLKDKIKPKIWWENNITKEERQTIYNLFIKKYPELSMELLYRYSKLEKYKNHYFIVTYKPHKIYFLDID